MDIMPFNIESINITDPIRLDNTLVCNLQEEVQQ